MSVFVHGEHNLKIYNISSQTYSHTELKTAKHADHKSHTFVFKDNLLSFQIHKVRKATCDHSDGGAALVLHQSELYGD